MRSHLLIVVLSACAAWCPVLKVPMHSRLFPNLFNYTVVFSQISLRYLLLLSLRSLNIFIIVFLKLLFCTSAILHLFWTIVLELLVSEGGILSWPLLYLLCWCLGIKNLDDCDSRC